MSYDISVPILYRLWTTCAAGNCEYVESIKLLQKISKADVYYCMNISASQNGGCIAQSLGTWIEARPSEFKSHFLAI